jgi:hypothetical protein
MSLIEDADNKEATETRRSTYEIYLSVSVISFISGSMG